MDNIVDIAVNDIGDQLDRNRSVFMDNSRAVSQVIDQIKSLDAAGAFGSDEGGAALLKEYLTNALPCLEFIQKGVDGLTELNGMNIGAVNVMGDADHTAATELAKVVSPVHVRT